MRIEIRLGEPLWRAVGARRLTMEFAGDPATVAGVLTRLEAAHPDFALAYRGQNLGHAWPYRLFVNARAVPTGGEDTWVLQEGDRLYIMLPAAGGSGSQSGREQVLKAQRVGARDPTPATVHSHLRGSAPGSSQGNNTCDSSAPLDRAFFARPTLIVARDLLGRQLVRQLGDTRLSGRIVEVEAYLGEEDMASHAARGPTPRNRAMYGRPGLAYVYLIYGVHHCLNVVTEAPDRAAAVLIRAVQPLEGKDQMRKHRHGRRLLADGPGKLCQALGIDRSLDGHDLTSGHHLWLEPGQAVSDEQVLQTARINVGGDERARTVPWRFVVVGQ